MFFRFYIMQELDELSDLDLDLNSEVNELIEELENTKNVSEDPVAVDYADSNDNTNDTLEELRNLVSPKNDTSIDTNTNTNTDTDTDTDTEDTKETKSENPTIKPLDANKQNPLAINVCDLYSNNKILEEKDKKAIIKSAERLVRSSIEYSSYLGQLKGLADLTRCSILGNIDTEMASIEMHHYPFSLYDIVDIVFNKKVERGEPITSITLMNEVLEMHFNHYCGMVPLSKTIHEMTHSGRIFINLDQVFWDPEPFLKKYGKYVPQHLWGNLEKIIHLSESKASYIDDEQLLETNHKSNLNKNEILLTNEDIESFQSTVLKTDSE